MVTKAKGAVMGDRKRAKYPLTSPKRARDAETRSESQYKAGKLTRSTKSEIQTRAKRVLRQTADDRRENPEDFARRWHEVTRAPIRLDGAWLADYGDALELEAGGHVIRWTGRTPFLWDAHQKAIVILQGAKRGRPNPNAEAPAKTESAFRAFMHREPEVERVDTFPGSESGRWKRAKATRFDYRSDKFRGRKNREFTHPLGPSVVVYRGGGTRPPWVWVIRGGKLRITPAGIEG